MTKKNNVAISHLIRSFFAFAMLLACLYPLTAQRITYKRERELQNRLQCANLSLLQKDKPMAMRIYKEVRDNGQYSPIALIANDSLMRNGYYEKDIETVWECLKYLEKYPEHFPAIENIPARIQDYRNRYSVLIDNITVHDDLCGIWVSDYTEDTHKAPYLILKIERVDDKYVAYMLPSCQTTWKFPTYFHTGKIAPTYVFPGKYKFSANSEFPVAPFGGNFDTKSFYAHFADKNYQKAHPEEAVMLAETGARVIDIARSLFKETTRDPDFFRESASFKTEVYGTTLALAGVGVSIGVLSAVLKNSKVRGYSVEFQGKYTVRGEMECILKEEASEINTFTGKEDDKSKQIKMRMLKIYPDYDIRFIGYNNSLVGSHSVTHKEAKASPEHKYRGEKILQYNTQSYNRLFESFVKSHEYSPDSVKTYISNHYNEFNVSNRGVSFGMVPTDYGHYYGKLKDGNPLDYEELKDDNPLDKKPKHLIKKENCLFVGYLKKNKREGQGTNYQLGDSTEVIMSTTGTWKDGKLSGQATQDDYIHHLHFEGEYSDGYRHGYGKLTDTVNNVVYEGKWNTRHWKECLNGDVVEKNLDGKILFSGKYKDNHREGGGTEHYWDGSTYRGIWKNDLKHGYGVLQIPDINATYSQIWRKGILKKGMDIERNESGEIVFNGEYKNDQRDGYGTEYQEDGDVFKGYWKKGAKHGKGVFYDMNKSYDQTWRYGILKRGRAVERNEKGEVLYEGSYRNDKRDGYGTEFYGNGCVYTGYWKNGVKHGKGVLNIPNTNESYKEEWKKGMIIQCNQF